jgi:hypothetical protein
MSSLETPEKTGTGIPGPHQEQKKLPDEQAVNILRERTFNEELRTLVTRVTGRGGGLHTEAEKKEVSGTSANDMLRMFHKLFYRARNIPWKGEGIALWDLFEKVDASEP